MKRILAVITATTLMVTATQAARQNAVEKEMEDYVRDLFRAHPEAAGDDKPRNAAEKMYKEAQQLRLLELSKDDEKKLRKREEMVTQGRYSSALDDLKALNSKDPKITFLIKYAENPKIKTDEKLLAYRLIQYHYKKAAEQAARDRSKRLAIILTKYEDYKKANGGKAPASLADLDLPEDCQKFTNSQGEKVDWIYIGHLGASIKTNNSHIVLAEPEPLGDKRVCGMDDGNVAHFNNSEIQPYLEKLANAKGGGGGQPVAAGALVGFMKKYNIFKELNNNKEPSSIDDLDLADKDKKYTDPSNGEKIDWIFLGKSSRISVGGDVKVIVVAPKAHNGGRLAGLSNGKVVKIEESKIAPLLNK